MCLLSIVDKKAFAMSFGSFVAALITNLELKLDCQCLDAQAHTMKPIESARIAFNKHVHGGTMRKQLEFRGRRDALQRLPF